MPIASPKPRRPRLAEGSRIKHTIAFDPKVWKLLESHCAGSGSSIPRVIEAAILSHLSGDDLDRRMDLLNRALMDIQRRLSRIEFHEEITSQTLGNYILSWLMATPELPDDARRPAYISAKARFDRFVEQTGRQIHQNKVWYTDLAKDHIPALSPELEAALDDEEEASEA